jgi:hypothetical protein
MLHFQGRVSMIILGVVKTGRLFGGLMTGPSETFSPFDSEPLAANLPVHAPPV